MRAIKRVQRRATKIVPALRNNSYYDHLVALNLPSLLYRRWRMDMIMIYLIVKDLEGIPFDNLFVYGDTSTRSNGYKLYKQFSHLNIRKYSFSQRIIKGQLKWRNFFLDKFI